MVMGAARRQDSTQDGQEKRWVLACHLQLAKSTSSSDDRKCPEAGNGDMREWEARAMFSLVLLAQLNFVLHRKSISLIVTLASIRGRRTQSDRAFVHHC